MKLNLDVVVNKATIFVIDDDRSVLESIFHSLQSTGLDIECFSSAGEFLAATDEPRHGCVVTDVKMPGMSGLQLQAELQDRGEHIPVILISGNADVPMALTAMKRGAFDFLEKPYLPQRLRELVIEAANLDVIQKQAHAQKEWVCKLIGRLTSEELKVAEGIAAGKTAKIIASDLGLSVRTVQFRRASAMDKLNVNRADLVELVLEARKVLDNVERTRLPVGSRWQYRQLDQ